MSLNTLLFSVEGQRDDGDWEEVPVSVPGLTQDGPYKITDVVVSSLVDHWNAALSEHNRLLARVTTELKDVFASKKKQGMVGPAHFYLGRYSQVRIKQNPVSKTQDFYLRSVKRSKRSIGSYEVWADTDG
jgi:hypothetical protein